MRVLVIFPGALGDLICALPAIRAIIRRHPDAAIELMARADLARFAVGRLGVVAGHSIDRREVGMLFKQEDDPAARDFFGRFDRIYSFFAADDPAFRRSLEAACLGEISLHAFRSPGAGHISELYLSSIDADRESLFCPINLSAADLDAADCILHTLEVNRSSYLLIFPGSGSPTKSWPLDRFIELGRTLSASIKVVVVLGPAEQRFRPHLDRSELATLADLPLETVAALSHLAAGFVGNDSGVSHLAAASGARGVVMFGPTDPARWSPRGDTTHHVVTLCSRSSPPNC